MMIKSAAFIFDIDGTLVSLQHIWKQLFHSLYHDECGFELTDTELKSKFGPPEMEGHSAILQGRGLYSLEKVLTLMQKTQERMLGILSQTDLTSYLLPSVVECLAFIQKAEAGCACATGNMKPIANSILRGAGLESYFPVLSCSTPTTQHRYEIVAKAKRELEEGRGQIFESHRTYVIGDTPSDIKAAQALGLNSVAVATGNYSLDELCVYHPTILISGLDRLLPALSLEPLTSH